MSTDDVVDRDQARRDAIDRDRPRSPDLEMLRFAGPPGAVGVPVLETWQEQPVPGEVADWSAPYDGSD